MTLYFGIQTAVVAAHGGVKPDLALYSIKLHLQPFLTPTVSVFCYL
ncbi:MAG: hypothetical protein QOE55_2211 [Acidobacteriaceae bacterium]|jgi:hypothetical protein|nr:hypothetical protein [Acidobacteriaceae bacterium]